MNPDAPRRWMIFCSAMLCATLAFAGCSREGELYEKEQQEKKKKNERYVSLFTTPPPPKGKLTSDLDVRVEDKMFYDTLIAEQRKLEEQNKKRAAQRSAPRPASQDEEAELRKFFPHRVTDSAGSVSRQDEEAELRKLSTPPRPQPSHRVREEVVPIPSLIMRSPAEVSRKLGPPSEKGATERYGSQDLVYYYRAPEDMEPIRVFFEGGKKATSVLVTFRQPVSRAQALHRSGMTALSSQPSLSRRQGNLVWERGMPWKEGRVTLEAADNPKDSFWGVTAEALIKTKAVQEKKMDESWGVGP